MNLSKEAIWKCELFVKTVYANQYAQGEYRPTTKETLCMYDLLCSATWPIDDSIIAQVAKISGVPVEYVKHFVEAPLLKSHRPVSQEFT